MLYQVKLFDGTEFDIFEEEAEKAYPRFMANKNVILRGAFLNAKAISSIKPYTREHFGKSTQQWKWIEERDILKDLEREKLEAEKAKSLPNPKNPADV